MRKKGATGDDEPARDGRPQNTLVTPDGRPLVRLPLPGRKMPLLVPQRALATSITLIVLLVATGMVHHLVATTQEDAAEDIGGLPIGERTAQG